MRQRGAVSSEVRHSPSPSLPIRPFPRYHLDLARCQIQILRLADPLRIRWRCLCCYCWERSSLRPYDRSVRNKFNDLLGQVFVSLVSLTHVSVSFTFHTATQTFKHRQTDTNARWTCEGTDVGGSILMDGSHSPGGKTVTWSKNSSIPDNKSARSFALYATSWNNCAIYKKVKTDY